MGEKTRTGKVLLTAEGLYKEFPAAQGKGKEVVHAVTNVNLRIYEGETLALVGESGCGKSTLGKTLIRLYDADGGKLIFDDVDITKLNEKQFSKYRPQMQIIFQDPYASLNPRMNVFEIISEPLITYHKYSKEELREKVHKLMDEVGIAREFENRYPHQFSGGQRQRIGIARALALNPRLIVCDEPVSALDVSIQSQVLNLLKDLQEQYGFTYLFISHDLSVVKFIADRVCVMFLGSICELGDTEELYAHPLHPYTRFLLNAIPLADPTRRSEKRELLQGDIPSPVNPPSGCRFHTRCPYAKEICSREVPPCKTFGDRIVYCHFPLGPVQEAEGEETKGMPEETK
ncbi:MAG: ATP-binding cassette domain-containing protein [Eubacteriales bacterium]|nr:ATP-binding cassette domain-containing protein [Eubacteriales bacterium]